MKTNKLKQLTCILAGSLILSACNNNVGGSSNSNLDNTQAVVSQVTATSVTPEAGTKQTNYIRESIIDSFAGNFFAFPGNFGFNLLSGWLSGLIFQDDSQQQIFNGLKDIQNKLVEMDKKLEQSLNLSNDILQMLGEFYHTQIGDNLWQTLQQPQQAANFIQTHYASYTNALVFGVGDIKADELDTLYEYASEQCEDKQIFDVIGARNNLQSKQVNSLTQNNISRLFNEFVTDYASPIGGGAGEFYNLLKNRKQNYINALFAEVPYGDFMSKIDYYNYQNMLYKNTLTGAYQKLYNMQLAQLAYKYACGADIEINAPRIDKNWQGKAGFNEAAKALNVQYNKTYQQLEQNLEFGFASITNEDLYVRINNLFNTELLDKNAFSSNKLAAGQCSITGLVFEKLDNGHGILRLTAKCMLEQNSDKTAKFTTVHQDVPYKYEGSRITGTPYNHLRFDANYPSALVFTNRNKDSFNSDDIKVLTTNNEISDAWSWCDVKNLNRIADSWTDTYENWITKFYWSAAQIDLSDDVSIFSERYLAGYNALGDDARRILPPFGYGLDTSGYSSLLQYPGFCGSNPDDSPKGWYAQWHLLSYNGKQALLKVEFLNSSTERQWVGIGCMNTFADQSCHREDKNTLVWEDGTKLTLNGQMSPIPSISRNNNWQQVSGKWSITGSAPTNYEVLPKK